MQTPSDLLNNCIQIPLIGEFRGKLVFCAFFSTGKSVERFVYGNHSDISLQPFDTVTFDIVSKKPNCYFMMNC